MLIIALLCLCATLATAVPDWNSKSYIAEGLIILPYGEGIEEPFKALIDPIKKRSRIEYYGGMNTILFLSGLGYKIVPSVNHNVSAPAMMCYNVTGGIGFQSVLPDISQFKVFGTSRCYYKKQPRDCTVYRYSEMIEQKTNTYDMHVIEGDIPVYFNFTGIDALMGSHYDEYNFQYTDFKEQTLTDSDFKIPSAVGKCGSFPGPGASGSMLDPMSEFIGSSDRRNKDSDMEFEDFKEEYSKAYESYEHHESRKSIFRHARRFIHSTNRKNLGYTLAINHLADLKPEEIRARNGYRYSGIGEKRRISSNEVLLADFYVDSMNWTARGAVNRPKDQGICGSCWSFGTTGTIEGSYFLKYGKLLDLSEQSLVDCTWGEGNNGCDGGETERVCKWLLESGEEHCVVTRHEYAAAAGGKYNNVEQGYLMADGVCHWLKTNKTDCVKIVDYTVLPQGDINALRQSSATIGPIQVAIDASRPTFGFYSSGVYYDDKCKNGVNDLDHSVLLAGFGTEDGKDYWLVKNSWSTHWGDNGYIKMSTMNNNCGVATDAVYATIG